jgi:cytochrome b
VQSPMNSLAHADGLEHGQSDQDREHPKGGVGNHQEKLWEEVHESMTNIMIALIVVHILGVIVSSWIHKENLVWAMITGKKKIDLDRR